MPKFRADIAFQGSKIKYKFQLKECILHMELIYVNSRHNVLEMPCCCEQ